jgi:hypothetical protein
VEAKEAGYYQEHGEAAKDAEIGVCAASAMRAPPLCEIQARFLKRWVFDGWAPRPNEKIEEKEPPKAVLMQNPLGESHKAGGFESRPSRHFNWG